MRPEGIRSNIFSLPSTLSALSQLSLDTSYGKLRVEVSGKHNSILIEQTVILRV